jgi:flagellar motility protein MotE (MotC chaperone)
LRDIRLMPIVLLAIACLFVLKSMGLFFDGGYTLGQRLGSSGTLVVTTVPIPPVTQMRSPAQALEVPSAQPSGSQPSFMQQRYGYPGGGPAANANSNRSTGTGDVIITGSVGSNKAGDKLAEKRDEKEPPVPPGPESIAARGTVVSMDQQRPASAGERALLERLQERRQELDARAREMDLRESMLKAAEKKLESQAAQEADKSGPNGQRKEDSDNARFKGVVIMYETMKPKDAAKIFDRLDPKVLIEVASQIKPQRMSEIMSQMSPEAAERLTVEMATRGPADRTLNPANLPKIDGRPGG